LRALTSPKTYDCDICGASLKSQLGLDNHLCLLHDRCRAERIGGPITFRCALCGEAFERRDLLIVHLRESGHGHPIERDPLRPPTPQRLAGRSRRRRV
jgi:hypothetical protein